MREFRDRFLSATSAGKGIVALYYRTSPFISRILTRHDSMKSFTKVLLFPFVMISDFMVKPVGAEKIYIIIAVILSFLSLIQSGKMIL